MFASFLLHALAILLVVLLSPSPVNVVRIPAKNRDVRNRILLQPIPAPSKGGGGGTPSPLPPTRGERPRFALRQFTPPVVAVVNPALKLAVEPTIVVEANPDLAFILKGPIGLPNGIPGPPSGGPGTRGGIGTGDAGGLGDGDGPGSQRSTQVLRLTGGMSPPVVLYKSEPEYSEHARKARVEGTIVVEGVITERGHADALRIRDGLGFGLDEQALEAVKLWRFKPALRNGKPVAIVGTFEINFRLL